MASARPKLLCRSGGFRIRLQRLFEVWDGFVRPPDAHQSQAETVMDGVILRIQLQRFLVFRNGLGQPAGAGQRRPQIVVDPGIAGIGNEQFAPFRRGRFVLAVVAQFHGVVELLVHLDRRRGDVLDPIRRNIHEFRQVHGAIGRGGVIDQDGGAVVAVRVDVGEIHLRVRRSCSWKKTPASRPLGEKLCQEFMSGVLHAHASRFAALAPARCTTGCRAASTARSGISRRRSNGHRAKPWGTCCSCRWRTLRRSVPPCPPLPPLKGTR